MEPSLGNIEHMRNPIVQLTKRKRKRDFRKFKILQSNFIRLLTTEEFGSHIRFQLIIILNSIQEHFNTQGTKARYLKIKLTACFTILALKKGAHTKLGLNVLQVVYAR